jgi:hypothetical protein
MPGFEQNIRGYNRLMNKLRRLAADNPEIGDEPIREFSQEQRAELKGHPYPSKRPDQRYQRTGQLANRYRVVKEDVGRYKIVNHARSKAGKLYAGWVVGVKQAWMHVKRWYQAHKVIQGNMPKLTAKLSEVYRQIWRE